MLQKMMKKNDKGFTLIELMIVIAIIGILAAIAVPQFLTYRLRSYNTAAKGIVHNLKADNGNLNAELGNYGWTEAAAADLTAATAEEDTADAVAVPALRLAATAARAGARLAGTNFKDYSVGISLGDNMIANVRGGSQYICVARHYKGDTAYGIDADVENQLYSVSNPAWPNTAGIACTMPVSNTDKEDFTDDSGSPIAGNGAPTTTWMKTQ